MNKIVFLVSGNGGNLKFIHHYLKASPSKDFVIASVISDRECGALDFARNNSIDSHQIVYNRKNNKELLQRLNAIDPDMIITNIHKILDEEVVNKYSDVLINLHYSLLPAFQGLIGVDPINQALDQGCKFIGTTVHHVELQVDAGKIIGQTSFPIPKEYERSNIIEHVFRSGCLNLLNALHMLAGKDFKTYNSSFQDKIYTSTIAPGLLYDLAVINEELWQKVAS